MNKTKENTIIEKTYELIKFKDGYFSLDVNVSPSEDTVWLNLEQLSLLFERDKSVISRHISNIIVELELMESSVIAFFATTSADGKTYFKHI
jgi:DNA ligase (NAD+)